MIPRKHICHRWVGGSHTLVAGHVKREKAAAPLLQATPTQKYTGYGSDGRLYMMEKELKPCAECNKRGADGDLSSKAPSPSLTDVHSPAPAAADGERYHGLLSTKLSSTAPGSDHA
ncbi:hypothetical protein PYW07_012494 [Mythimna separata]|uniref:Uncharacterized protein n=1 Tax=Mythimna separata TaxID=271217 RepID=A0AAD8DTM8_MYTSE|nr:hypothetical protein PYW07_012494 [Mythimna separata]